MYNPQIGAADVAHNLKLYSNNYMPEHHEALALKTALDDHDRLLQDINERIFALESQLQGLYSQRNALATTSVVKKALIAPVRRLAPETLGYVFQLACEDEVLATGDRRMITPTTMQLQLALVSRRWRSVVLGTPYLY
ncbi:hypothetical protein M422DRAFT_151332, partial [Sphaerobolus stellatus SS14]